MNDFTSFFEELYSQNKDALYRTAYAATGDREIAADLVQDTLYMAMKHSDAIYHHKNPSAYLFTTLRNLIKNEYRRREYYQKLLYRIHYSSNQSTMELNAADYRSLLDTYLDKKEADILSDYYVLGQPLSLICQKYRISMAATRMRISRAKTKLEKNIKTEHPLKECRQR
ncbi:RNA polymerase sigma factor, sigma-70 family [Evansella caseinilytica]|uniref:RNA polymerase sigma factor, sigma-70 family n=1 Tax=Evansella caseinilytica TaxID=1503961 RepID=A0A1H3TFD8_9BACI|nr:sigma-70 family RNA polymerase sigma factor [Evansella caseinilytica]SDZ48375.1 RNA polymerase sigma factor, sigma-70 family [Evansella caseinilytica]